MTADIGSKSEEIWLDSSGPEEENSNGPEAHGLLRGGQFIPSLGGDLDRRCEMDGRRQRIGNQAFPFCLLQDALRVLSIPAGWQSKMRAHVEGDETRCPLDAIESAGDVAFKRRPRKSRPARDRAERQDQTVANRGDEQRFRRPAITWSTELRR